MFLAFFIFYFLPALPFLRNSSRKNSFFYLLIISPAITSFFSLLLLYLDIFNFWIVFFLNFLLFFTGFFNIKNYKFSFKFLPFPFFLSIIIFPFFLIQGEPFEGASDAGVYTSSALNLLEKGRYWLEFEEHLPDELKKISIKETGYQFNWKETFPGIVNIKDRFVPQFFPLYSIHLAIFYKIFGVKGLLFCNFWFYFLSLIVFYRLLNLFLPSFYSKLSIILFSLNPGIIYFIKYPTAEVFLCYLILSFLLFFIISLKNENFYFISSLFLALSLTTKFLSYFLLAGIFLFFVIYKEKGKFKKFLIFFSIFSLLPALSIILFNYPYFLNHLLPSIRLKYILILIIFSLLIFFLKNLKISKNLLNILPFLFLFISLWALFIRTNKFEAFEENNLWEFSWYTGIIVLNISFLGAFFSFFKKKNLFLNINYYLFLILIIFGTGDNPLHPFSFRRYIPLFLPLTCFYFSFLLKDFKIKKMFSIILLIIAFVFPLYKGKSLIFSREGKGFLNLYFEGISRDFPQGTLCTSDTYFLSSQLNLAGKKKIYPLNIEDPEILLNFQDFMKKNEKFYLFSALHYNFPVLFEIKGEIEHLQQERNKIPSKFIKIKPEFYLYEVLLKDYKESEIKIGENDFGRISGFWDLEFDGERFFKWTKREAFFYLKVKNKLIFLIDKGGNPENPVPFRIYIGDKLIFEGFAEAGWKQYSFSVPEEIKGKGYLFKIVTHSFQPLPDTRELGLKISEILSY